MKIYKITATFLLSVLSMMLSAQPVEISVQVLQSFSPQAKIYLYTGSDVALVDSSIQIAPGTYKFTLNEGYQQGMYRVDVGKGISFNIIVSNEPFIDVSTMVYAPEDSLRSFKSMENKLLWEFQKRKKQHKQHVWLIQSLMDYYSDSTIFYHLLDKELNNQNRKLNQYAKGLTEDYPDLLASQYIKLEQRPQASYLLEGDAKIEYLKDIWWDNVDLLDGRLLHSPALQLRLWNYIELFFSDDYDKEQQDEAFIDGISELMNREMLDDLKIFIRKTLIIGFSDSDYLPVVEYLETTQFGTLSPIKQKLPIVFSKISPKVKVGETAYDFSFELPHGKKVKLSKIKADYKLIVFWSTWCPHCIETLPRIGELYENYKDLGLEVIAISIDEEESHWKRYVDDLKLNWINIREPISKSSELLYMYDVNETPKMFLLSKDLTIISRPSTRRQLEVKLKRLTR